MYLPIFLIFWAEPSLAAVLAERAVTCDFATTADPGATCSSFASSWGLSVEDLKQLNPGITCPNIELGKSYCVIGTATSEPSTTTITATKTSMATSTRSTTSTDSASGHSPTMPGIASNCDAFYKVTANDQCDTIAAKNGISEAQFKSWNSEVDSKCTNLWLGYYVCVHVPGATKPVGPTPQMPGIVADCKSYHMIQDGDSCDSIDAAAKITLAQFRSWNTQIDSNCSNLWLGYYVCFGV